MTAVEIAIVAVPVVDGLAAIGQIAVLAWGIRALNAQTRKHAAERIEESKRWDEEYKRRREESRRQHEKTMAELEASIARSRGPDDAS